MLPNCPINYLFLHRVEEEKLVNYPKNGNAVKVPPVKAKQRDRTFDSCRLPSGPGMGGDGGVIDDS